MAKSMTGKGPGPSGAPRSFAAGPGAGKVGIKAIGGKVRNVAMPEKAAPGGSPRGMSTYSNTRKVK